MKGLPGGEVLVWPAAANVGTPSKGFMVSPGLGRVVQDATCSMKLVLMWQGPLKSTLSWAGPAERVLVWLLLWVPCEAYLTAELGPRDCL